MLNVMFCDQVYFFKVKYICFIDMRNNEMLNVMLYEKHIILMSRNNILMANNNMLMAKHDDW